MKLNKKNKILKKYIKWYNKVHKQLCFIEPKIEKGDLTHFYLNKWRANYDKRELILSKFVNLRKRILYCKVRNNYFGVKKDEIK